MKRFYPLLVVLSSICLIAGGDLLARGGGGSRGGGVSRGGGLVLTHIQSCSFSLLATNT
jgi:hypothetical protein